MSKNKDQHLNKFSVLGTAFTRHNIFLTLYNPRKSCHLNTKLWELGNRILLRYEERCGGPVIFICWKGRGRPGTPGASQAELPSEVTGEGALLCSRTPLADARELSLWPRFLCTLSCLCLGVHPHTYAFCCLPLLFALFSRPRRTPQGLFIFLPLSSTGLCTCVRCCDVCKMWWVIVKWTGRSNCISLYIMCTYYFHVCMHTTHVPGARGG